MRDWFFGICALCAVLLVIGSWAAYFVIILTGAHPA